MYIDTHSHLNLDQFTDDIEAVIDQMRTMQIRTQTVGVDVSTSVRALEIAAQFPELSRALVGMHPAYVQSGVEYDHDLLQLRSFLDNPLCVGIGECGFDYFRSAKSEVYDAQQFIFHTQMGWAQEVGLPVMLHIRPTRDTYDAYDDALEVLRGYPGVRGQAHFFAGTLAQAQQFLDLGYHISCTGVVTFTHDYDEVVQYVPIDRLLLETDAPYVAPAPYRGARCEPWHVIEVYKRVAELRNIPIADLQDQMSSNVSTLYGW